jgi:hypothetical protein
MNRPAGNRSRAARHALAGQDSVLSSIPQPPSPQAEIRAPGQPAQPQPRDARIMKRVAGSWRYLLPIVAGTVATAIPAVRAVIWTVNARPGCEGYRYRKPSRKRRNTPPSRGSAGAGGGASARWRAIGRS